MRFQLFFLIGALAGVSLHADIPLDLGSAKQWMPYRSASVVDVPGASGTLIFQLPTFAARAWRFSYPEAEKFNRTKGIAFQVRGDGAETYLSVKLLTLSFSFHYYATVPVKGTEWQSVTIAWEDFINLSNRTDLVLGKSDAMPLSGIMGISFGDRWSIGYANEPLKQAKYVIRDLRLVDDAVASYVPLKKTPPPLATVIQKMKQGKKVLIYCHGDSITAGTGVKEARYANLLGESLRKFFKNPNIEVKTIAIGGALSSDLRLWAHRDFSGGPKVDLVTISIGANDFNNDKTPVWFKHSVGEWIDRVVTYTNGETAFLLIPTLPGQAWYKNGMNDFAEAMRALAAERGLDSCDVARRFYRIPDAELKDYFNDTLHPNRKGHQLISEELMKYIREQSQ